MVTEELALEGDEVDEVDAIDALQLLLAHAHAHAPALPCQENVEFPKYRLSPN